MEARRLLLFQSLPPMSGLLVIGFPVSLGLLVKITFLWAVFVWSRSKEEVTLRKEDDVIQNSFPIYYARQKLCKFVKIKPPRRMRMSPVMGPDCDS